MCLDTTIPFRHKRLTISYHHPKHIRYLLIPSKLKACEREKMMHNTTYKIPLTILHYVYRLWKPKKDLIRKRKKTKKSNFNNKSTKLTKYQKKQIKFYASIPTHKKHQLTRSTLQKTK